MLTQNGSDLFFAPIAGYSDSGLRSLCFRYGAGLCFTEMVSAKGLYYKNENTASLLYVAPDESNTAVQLFGSEPEIFAEVVRYPVLSKFSHIDVNMGCPVRKITSNNEGSALLRNPELIYKIVKAVKDSSGKTVSVKMRTGIDGKSCVTECALAAQEGGVDLVTVHGRTKEQLYGGKCDFETIAHVKQTLRVPVCGNGDVTDRDSYLRMKETGVDYVMIARGALGKPYVFSEILGKEYTYERNEAILFHIGRLCEYLSENTVMNVMKKQIACYLHGSRGAKQLKEQAFSAHSLKELTTLFDIKNN